MPRFLTPFETQAPPAVPPRPSHDAVAYLSQPHTRRVAPPPSWSPGWFPVLKVVGEFTASAFLLIAVSPLIALAAVLVKLTSRGPAFYSQMRLGQFGKPFWIHKIRTMTHDCESETGACWAKADDPRITPLGKLLRATHLDELPQLWNVLRGDMSLVGPRPERPEFVPKLEQSIPHYRARLELRPGVTGLAQVQMPADTDIDSVRRKLAYDLFYLRYMGPWLDLKIVLCTVLHVVGVPYSVVGRLFGLPGQERVESAYQERLETPLRLSPVPAS